jgi:hypothetical protein
MSALQARESIEQRIKARDSIPKAPPAYLPTAGSPLSVDKEVYATIQKAPRVLIDEFTLPIRAGRAWEAPAGSIVKISTPEGPQVGESMRNRLMLSSHIIKLSHAHDFPSRG